MFTQGTVAREHWLLLTATISPPQDAANLVVISPEERLKQYQASLNFYIEKHLRSTSSSCVDGIVFAENSGSDLNSIAKTIPSSTSDQVALHGWSEEYLSPAFDRGYRELRLIDRVCDDNPQLAAALDRGAVIWKVTGRYRVENISSIIAYADTTASVHVDLRRWPKPWCEMRVMGFDRDGLDLFIRPVLSHLRTGIATEELLHHLIEDGIFSKSDCRAKISRRFRVEPRVDGIRGGDGKNYLMGRNYAKYILRRTLRCVGRLASLNVAM